MTLRILGHPRPALTSAAPPHRPIPAARKVASAAVAPISDTVPLLQSILPKPEAARFGGESTSASTETNIAAQSTPGKLSKLLPWRQTANDVVKDVQKAEEFALAQAVAVPAQPILGIAGGGVFFFWEIGVLKYLSENFDLKQTMMVGVSAGALCSVLCACNVNPDRAVREAFRLSVEENIWDRPGGLAGIWGGIIRKWLDELLPADAHERCSGRVRIIATDIPTLRLSYLDDFEDRDDLIDACMASVHIPFFLDGNASYSYRGKQFVDGSLWDFFSGQNSSKLTCDGAACVVDYFNDDQLQFSRLDFIKLSSYEEVKALVTSGYAYAQRTDTAGGFEEKLGDVRKGVVRRVAEFPVYAVGKLFSEA